MIKKIKNGFVSIEVVIVAALILAVGLAGITAMGVKGQQTASNGLDKLDALGVFGEGGEGSEYATGYPSGLQVVKTDVNAEDDFTYEWSDSLNGWIVTSYTNDSDKDVIIPVMRSDNKAIVALDENAFLTKALNSIVMPNSVQQIGASALRGNQLTEVVLPSNLTIIGDAAFRENQLQALVLPDSVNSVGMDAFSNNQLATLDLPDSLTSISASAFSVNQLTAVTLPSNLTTISASAFQSNLITHLTIPNTVSSLGTSAFRNNRLTSIIFEGPKPTTLGTTIFSENTTLPDASIVVPLDQVNSYVASTTSFGVTVPKFANADPNLEDGLRYQWNATLSGWEVYEYVDKTDKSIVIPDTRNGGEPVVSVAANTFKDGNITSLTLSNNLKNIGASAFQNNQLTSLVIPTNVTTLGNDAFGTNLLTNIIFNGNKPTTLGTNIFTGNTGLPDGSIWVSSAQLLTYRANASRLGVNEAKIGANPSDVNVEGEFVYRWYSFYNGWEVIDYINKTDKTVVIPDTRSDGKPIVSVASSTFQNLSLTSVVLSNNTKVVNSFAFKSNKLTTVSIPGSVYSIGDRAFEDNLISNLSIANGVVSITDFAFNNNKISSLVLPDSLNNIGIGSFSNNTLTSLTLPSGLYEIDEQAFYNNLLTTVTIPSATSVIGNFAFSRNKLTSVVFEGEVSSIGNDAFSNNSLSSVVIPYSVMSLGDYSFDNNLLVSVTFDGDIPSALGAFIFNRNAGLTTNTIRVPSDSLESYQAVASSAFSQDVNDFVGY